MFSMFISASLYTLSDSEVKVETSQAEGGIESLRGNNLPTGGTKRRFYSLDWES
jgi:hypothetical protein